MAQELFLRKVSKEDNRMLCETFTKEEVHNAMWSCDSSKIPGPDGFNIKFFKECLGTIKDDLMKMMEEFHQNEKVVRGLNTYFIVIIPKKEDARQLGEYRLIPLIRSTYKILVKVLAGRLSKVLDSIISENQSAFV